MLSPEYLLHISEGAEEIAEQLHSEIVNRIIERMMVRIGRGDDYLLTATDKWNLDVLQEAGYLLKDIQTEIAKATKLQKKEIKAAFEEAGVKALEYDDNIYKAAGLYPTPLTQSPHLMRLMQRNYEATLGEWKNFTRTTAKVSQQTFIRAMDKAYTLTTSGTISYTQAVREAIKEVSAEGVTVMYPSGRVDTIETATLRAVRTGVSQATAQIQLARMKEMGNLLAITSSHLGARPSHEIWQGRIFYVDWNKMDKIYPLSEIPTPSKEDEVLKEKYPDFVETTGIGEVDGLCGANCRHSFSCHYEGQNNPFEKYDSEENKKVYELSQRQRAMERRIRKTKREVMARKAAVDNASDKKLKFELDLEYQKKASLLKKQNQAYNDFCEKNNLKRLPDRLETAKWDRQQAAEARGAAERYQNAKTGTELEENETVSRKIAKKFDELTRENPPVALSELNADFSDELVKKIDNAPEVIRNIIRKNESKIKFAKINAIGGNRNTKNGIYTNFSNDMGNSKGPWTSTFHEIGHRIDKIYGRVSHNAAFGKALRRDFDAFTKTYKSMYNITDNEAYEIISERLSKTTIKESHVLSDLFGGLTNNKCVGQTKHESDYWTKKYALEREAFAHFFSASALGYEDKLNAIKSVFPNAYNEFAKIVGEL